MNTRQKMGLLIKYSPKIQTYGMYRIAQFLNLDQIDLQLAICGYFTKHITDDLLDVIPYICKFDKNTTDEWFKLKERLEEDRENILDDSKVVLGDLTVSLDGFTVRPKDFSDTARKKIRDIIIKEL